jgi:hypothetical protein
MVRCHWCRSKFLIPVWTRLAPIGLDMLSRSISTGEFEERTTAEHDTQAA